VELALEEIVAFLARDKAIEPEMRRCPLRLDDLPRGQCRAADVEDFSLPHEVVERAQGLLDRRPGFGDMLIIKVDPGGMEPGQAGLEGGRDIAPRRAL